MARCFDCHQDMLDSENVKTCTFNGLMLGGSLSGNAFRAGSIFQRDSTYFDYNERCHDCGIENKEGNFHHLGCSLERCPKCGGQLISCGCGDQTILAIRINAPIVVSKG